MSNMQLAMVHDLVVSNVRYLENSTSGCQYAVIFGSKMVCLRHQLLSFHDIDN